MTDRITATVDVGLVALELALAGRPRTYVCTRRGTSAEWDRSHPGDALLELVDGDRELASDIEDAEYSLVSLSDRLLERRLAALAGKGPG